MSSIDRSKPRALWADALRVVAILMVVMIHTAAPLFTTQPVGSAGFVAGWLLDGLVQAGVPLFVMVSGVFMLEESRQVTIRRAVCRYALPMVALYGLWSGVYALANKVAEPLLLGGASLSGAMVGDFLQAWVEGAYHLWYLPMTVGLYLITPLLRSFVKRADPRPAVYFVLLSLLFGFGVPAAVRLAAELGWTTLPDAVSTFHLDVVAVYPGYYVAGWLLAGWRPARRTRWGVYAAGVLCLVGMMALTGWESYRHGVGTAYWMQPTSPLCAVYSAALFALFCWGLGSCRVRPGVEQLVLRLARLSFGVYVVHVEIQALYKVLFPYEGSAPWGYALAQWAAVAAISFVAAWILGRIPGVRRAVRG